MVCLGDGALIQGNTPLLFLDKPNSAPIDYRIGQALAKAKEELDHGQFLPACEALGYSKYEPSRLINWYEEASKIAQCANLDPAIAEQKLSRKAREEFCRSTAAQHQQKSNASA